MKVDLQCVLSDSHLDLTQASSQRQLAVSVAALPEGRSANVPLNLCLVLDHSGSMAGQPLKTVQQAACRIVDSLTPEDRLTIVLFDHQAKVLVPQQPVLSPDNIKQKIKGIRASGGTAIDEGLKFGIEEVAKGREGSISQVFLLTDGENEHGDNERCLKLAHLAADYNLTLSTLGFGDHWNQDMLERIADAGGGSLSYIQEPEDAIAEFSRLFTRIQSVSLTNAHLIFNLLPGVRLAELKPIAQVAPETVELTTIQEASQVSVRLGDLMVEVPRIVLANLYIGRQPAGTYPILQAQVQYDDPLQSGAAILSDLVTVTATGQSVYQPQPDSQVQRHVLALAKYRQTQIAEQKLQLGDRQGAVTLLQSAAKTALQMGDTKAATVLQDNATRLQSGQDLTERDRKQTRIVSKTVLH
ncbi:VWA domain-containing protein [Pseudanabaena sp. FACHB-2040]|uniref:vWA domain-containing protein n=1 Tax=Pseudanabaena sp. FACHB-2040 TaxID=2692859 RepID=UPI0016848C2F|nr:VWA domain-containing protein [Pseudanabaena sp. FACHB-2040]MBD0267897.1 VWA domain-containing protein [Cyanobacteria bacterium Co-bin8]MBD2258123.1 VWA domain-containing protein [Pseudanabaena sp. FACHB-2040]